MTARLLDGGDDDVCGILTSGGTESIVLATKAHRDFYGQVTPRPGRPTPCRLTRRQHVRCSFTEAGGWKRCHPDLGLSCCCFRLSGYFLRALGYVAIGQYS